MSTVLKRITLTIILEKKNCLGGVDFGMKSKIEGRVIRRIYSFIVYRIKLWKFELLYSDSHFRLKTSFHADRYSGIMTVKIQIPG